MKNSQQNEFKLNIKNNNLNSNTCNLFNHKNLIVGHESNYSQPSQFSSRSGISSNSNNPKNLNVNFNNQYAPLLSPNFHGYQSKTGSLTNLNNMIKNKYHKQNSMVQNSTIESIHGTVSSNFNQNSNNQNSLLSQRIIGSNNNNMKVNEISEPNNAKKQQILNAKLILK